MSHQHYMMLNVTYYFCWWRLLFSLEMSYTSTCFILIHVIVCMHLMRLYLKVIEKMDAIEHIWTTRWKQSLRVSEHIHRSVLMTYSYLRGLVTLPFMFHPFLKEGLFFYFELFGNIRSSSACCKTYSKIIMGWSFLRSWDYCADNHSTILRCWYYQNWHGLQQRQSIFRWSPTCGLTISPTA